jgi:hypothetical protein
MGVIIKGKIVNTVIITKRAEKEMIAGNNQEVKTPNKNKYYSVR